MEEEAAVWKSAESNSMVSATLGRVMTTLLAARPKKLQDAISRLDSAPKPSSSSIVSVEESLRIIYTHVKDAAQREESLDEILIPLTEHSLANKDSKRGSQGMILLNWLFRDEILFEALATNLTGIIKRKDDRFISLGWCILVRGLVEYEVTMKQFINNGIRQKYCSMLKLFSSCITHLVSIVCNGRYMYFFIKLRHWHFGNHTFSCRLNHILLSAYCFSICCLLHSPVLLESDAILGLKT